MTRENSTTLTPLAWLQAAISRQTDDCINWPFRTAKKTGYGMMASSVSPSGKYVRNGRAHRIAFFLANGYWPMPLTRHTCHNTLCVNPRHLLPGTQRENIDDKVRASRQRKGTDIHFAKLTPEIVLKIRAEYVYCKVGTYLLAERYGVNQALVHRIIKRTIWKHI